LCKIVQSNVVAQAGYPVFFVVARSPDGGERKGRLTADACLGVVAASNFKQRARKMMEYYYADRYQLAVAGTPNLLEYDQGFFVKNGDGSADFKPIAHLYKSQIYQLASAWERRRGLPPSFHYGYFIHWAIAGGSNFRCRCKNGSLPLRKEPRRGTRRWGEPLVPRDQSNVSTPGSTPRGGALSQRPVLM
jgi:hypothetical protein